MENILAFDALKLHPTLLKGIGSLGFKHPTPVQSEAIPHALEGRDLLACAATGSGKTAAFLLPMLHRFINEPRGMTRGLVLAPTRELALQIVDDFLGLARFTNLTAAPVYGGVKMGRQEKAFRKGVDLIVATPGRLLDHFQYDYAQLPGLQCLVLDEADRMLDMGFLPDVKRILRHVPKPEQTLFFSATMPPPIEKLTREILDKPIKVALQRKAAPASGVKQVAYPVGASLKGALLLELLNRGEIDDALVFTRTKHRANRLAKLLNRKGITAERIHGNRSQSQRTQALAGFKRGDFRVLVATDIAARGIDVEALGHVVNFDVPKVPEDYIHRVGRTARAQLTGEAFTFVSPDERNDFGKIERTVGSKIERAKLDDFAYDATAEAPLEVPRKERVKQIQKKRAQDRARAAAKKKKGAAGNKEEASGPSRPRRRRYGKRRG
ncbi:DEAD/DEAH box helicase [Gemmatimonadales bacterium]|nr:DEAD/DEAH box helicase [Gemmatimonadales bacterium]